MRSRWSAAALPGETRNTAGAVVTDHAFNFPSQLASFRSRQTSCSYMCRLRDLVRTACACVVDFEGRRQHRCDAANNMKSITCVYGTGGRDPARDRWRILGSTFECQAGSHVNSRDAMLKLGPLVSSWQSKDAGLKSRCSRRHNITSGRHMPQQLGRRPVRHEGLVTDCGMLRIASRPDVNSAHDLFASIYQTSVLVRETSSCGIGQFLGAPAVYSSISA